MTRTVITDKGVDTCEIDIDVQQKKAIFIAPDNEWSPATIKARAILKPIGRLLAAAKLPYVMATFLEFYGFSWEETIDSVDIGKKLTIGPFNNVLLEYEATEGVGEQLERVHIRPQYGTRRKGLPPLIIKRRRRVQTWWADFYFKEKPIYGQLKIKYI